MYALSWATWEERLNRLKGSRDVTKNALVRYFHLVSFSDGRDPVLSVISIHSEVHVEGGEHLTRPLCDSLTAQNVASETSNTRLAWALARRWGPEACFWETLQGDSYTQTSFRQNTVGSTFLERQLVHTRGSFAALCAFSSRQSGKNGDTGIINFSRKGKNPSASV